MNIKKVEKQLKKINQLFDNIKEDGIVSAIEKDLMLSYVRVLYEKMIEAKETVEKKPKKEAPVEVIEEVTVVKSNPIADAVLQEIVEKKVETVSEVAAPAAIENSTVVEIQEPVVEEVIEAVKPTIPSEVLELFEHESGTELSDKLSRAPIDDLTKCMGINEKIFTVQELFGGDSALFTSAMEAMDKFSSLEQARDYLVDTVAIDQNWASESKSKKASNFIKLISRRY